MLVLDGSGAFKGVIDFNIAGRDTLLNLIMREAPFTWGDTGKDAESMSAAERAKFENNDAVRCIQYALAAVSREYRFSDAEREMALPLFRYVKALWWSNCECLEAAKTDKEISAALDEAERMLTEEFEFVPFMN